MLINRFQNGKNSNVISSQPINDILKTIKEGDENLQTIQSLRQIGKSNTLFDEIKISKLPTFRFNFRFNKKANNTNIISATGLIYIDVDNVENITNNQYVYASWQSISSTGYGILVKVDNLTLQNFQETYNDISAELGLPTDVGARKATQQTVLSYDPQLYFNQDSITFSAKSKKVSFVSNKKEERGCVTTNDTFLKDDSNKLRFDNTDEYFNDDSPFIVFSEQKESMCIPFIPRRIDGGSRNSTMFFILSQYALLNQTKGESFLRACANIINNNMSPKLEEGEIKGIISSVIKKREDNTLDVHLNKERRIIFNPNLKIDKKEKQKIVCQEISKLRRDKTSQEIYDVIEDWDFEKDGKITQGKVAIKTNKSTITIKRYWSNFKDYATDLNNNNRQNNNIVTNSKTEPLIGDIELNEDDLFLLELKESASLFADNFIEEINHKHSDVMIDAVDVEYLSHILSQANIKFINKVLIQDDIDNGIIATIEELEERISY